MDDSRSAKIHNTQYYPLLEQKTLVEEGTHGEDLDVGDLPNELRHSECFDDHEPDLQRKAAAACGADWVIVPDDDRHAGKVLAWNSIVCFAVLCVAFYQPYALTLLKDDRTAMSYMLDTIFSIDMMLQFFTAFENSAESANSELWERNLSRIATRYVSLPFSYDGKGGWFWLDVLSILPGWVDAGYHVLGQRQPSDKKTRIWLLLRLFRLLRARHFTRVFRLSDNLNEYYGVPMASFEVVRFVLITSLTCHWMACLWVLTEGKVTEGTFSYQVPLGGESWLSALIVAKGDPCEPSAAENPNCVYSQALYWAVMTLTSVGYGDITPQNEMEYHICTLCMINVAFVWAYVVGSIVSLLSSGDPYAVQFRQNADDLTELMGNRHLSKDLQVRLRSYLHAARQIRRSQGQHDFLQSQMSTGLLREVALTSVFCKIFLQAVYWAKELEQDALLDMVRELEPRSYGPREVITASRSVVLMSKGLAANKGKILRRGAVWGESDVLLESVHLMSESRPRTLTYVEVLVLERHHILSVCEMYPAANHRIRRAQIKTAVLRAFVFTAKERVEMKKHAEADVLSVVEEQQTTQRQTSGLSNHSGRCRRRTPSKQSIGDIAKERVKERKTKEESYQRAWSEKRSFGRLRSGGSMLFAKEEEKKMDVAQIVHLLTGIEHTTKQLLEHQNTLSARQDVMHAQLQKIHYIESNVHG